MFNNVFFKVANTVYYCIPQEYEALELSYIC
jgi:hypothetical protein